MKKILNMFIMFASLFWYGCKEEGRLDHVDGQAPAPAPVTVTEVINTHGGALIRYKVPNDKNLAGVKVVYERGGEMCETKASLYVDSLVVEGFGDTRSRTVDLYSIGWNNKTSEPVSISITPLTPPVMSAAKEIEAAFGGVGISFSNHSRANLALVLLADTTEMDMWHPLQIFYTKADTGIFYRRGMEAKEQKFAMYVRDRWNNKSDTLIRYLTPLMEELLPKDGWVNQKLPGDTWEYVEGPQYAIEGVWDDITGKRNSNMFASKHDAPIPQHFTISLGYTASVNRMKVYQRPGDEYSGSSPRTFELWGSDDPPANGSWDNWYLLGKFEAFKPSGYEEDGSVGTITQEDKDYCVVDGMDYDLVASDEVPEPYMPVTHLRFRTTATFSTYGTDVEIGNFTLSELTFWGQIIK
ncbi:MAG: DUF4959 domain-containing protein [Bacteroidales bacterium]|nr:DUF4959 domain-containing protein [Bacteroidales bacterium]